MKLVIRNTMLLTALFASALLLIYYYATRGDFFFGVIEREVSLIFWGLLLGSVTHPTKNIRLAVSCIAAVLILVLPVCYPWLRSIPRLLYAEYVLEKIGFVLLGFSHWCLFEKQAESKEVTRWISFFCVSGFLYTLLVYFAQGWTSQTIMDGKLSTDSLRDVYFAISQFAAVVFYMSLFNLFRTDSIQSLASKKWFRWTAGCFVMVVGLFLPNWDFLIRHHHHLQNTVIITPALWYLSIAMLRLVALVLQRIYKEEITIKDTLFLK